MGKVYSFVFSILIVFAAACGDESKSSDNTVATGPTSSGTGANSISGTLSYSGDVSGVNQVQISASSDPTGFPVESYISYTSVTFPLEFTLSGISDGDFYIFTLLDRGAMTTGAPDADDTVKVLGTSAITFGSGVTNDALTGSFDE